MNSKLTQKEEELLLVIDDFIRRYGFIPSIRELCPIVGNDSPATVHSKLKMLKQKGFITYEKGKGKTIKIL